MELYDFTKYEDYACPMGGNAGLKLGVLIDGERWFIKFPKNIRGMGKVEISYSTSPLSEYIGSHVYELLGQEVHETRLGIYNGKCVVACKNFLSPGETLLEFKDIKNMYSEKMEQVLDSYSDAVEGPILNLVLETLEINRTLGALDGIKEHFWDMFVIDAFIGNNDRNNGNWGVITDGSGNNRIAPVYDNGNSFRNKASDAQLLRTLENEDALKSSAYRTQFSVYKRENGEAIKPFMFISHLENEECRKAVKRIVPKIDLQKIDQMIDEIPEDFQNVSIISKVQKEYCKKVMQCRYEDVLLPTLQKINGD